MIRRAIAGAAVAAALAGSVVVGFSSVVSTAHATGHSCLAKVPEPTPGPWNPDPHATRRPVVESPIGHRYGHRRAALAIEGPSNAWGVRTFAREAACQVPGLRIYTRGTCADHRGAVCLRVRLGHFDKCGCYAVTVTSGPYAPREIRVNLDATPSSRYAVVAHEFGHVLGLDHHRGDGVDGGRPDEVHLSPAELLVLRRAYPV